MRKVNTQALMEVIADLMSDNSITFRHFSNAFFDSRIHNKHSFLNTLELLKTDIISPEYLEGCYQLGQKYPDLCSSIFLLCGKGV